MSAEEDIARIAAQLADLTRTVEAMAAQLKAVADRADDHQERALTANTSVRKYNKSGSTSRRGSCRTSANVCKRRRMLSEKSL